MKTIITFEDFLKTYSQSTRERVKLYNRVLYLRKTYGYGSKKIAKILGISRYKFERWIYSTKRPGPIVVIDQLAKLGFFIPLKSKKTSKFELFVKLFAFTFGDGGISSIFQSYYTGEKKDLIQLKKEIKEILNLPSKIHKIEHKDNFIADRKVKGTSYSLVIQGKGSHSLGRLLNAACAPTGDKVVKSYIIPDWIMKGPKWIKKLFLDVLLGNELQTPRLDKSRKISFSPIRFLQVKIEEKKDSLRKFLNQLRKLLKEFGIRTSPVIEGAIRKDRRKDDKTSHQFYFYIRKEMTNVLRFYKIFQLRYASRKQRLFKESVEKAVKGLEEELLKTKLYFKSIKLARQGLGCRRIAKELNIPSQYHMIDGWLTASQKPEHFHKRRQLERILNNLAS